MKNENLFQTEVLIGPNEAPHTHAMGELLMVLEGSLVITRGEAMRLEQNDILYINGGEKHALRSVTKDALVFRCYLSYKLIKGDSYYSCSTKDNLDASYYHELKEVIRGLLVDYYAGSEKTDFLRMSLCYRLVHILETYFRVSIKTTDQENRIKIMCSYIEQNYTEELTLQSMADTFHFSSAYLSRLFKERMGENIIPYLNRVRMRHAVEDLVSSDDTVTQIALNNGFASATAFYSNFNRIYGMKPLEYRARFKTALPEPDAEQQEAVNQRLGEHLNYYKVEKAKVSGKNVSVRCHIDKGVQVKQVFNTLVNLGEVEQIRISSVRDMLRRSCTELGFRYVRIWNVFPPEVYEGKPWRDFSALNDAFDFFRQNSLIPFIQIGGERLPEVDVLKQNFHPVSSFQTVEDLINACRTLIDYTLRIFPADISIVFELRGALFEAEGQPNKENYLTAYRKLYDLLKKRMPDALLGGPGLPLHIGLEKNILARWAEIGLEPDFFAFSSYPYRSVPGAIKYLPDTDYLVKDLSQLQNQIQQYFGKNIPVYITEWNAFLSSRNYFQDSLWKGCYTAKLYADTLGTPALIGHSRLFDDLEASGHGLLKGGLGMLTQKGIPKPIYAVARCFRSMGSYVLANEDGALITSRGRGTIRMLLYNYKHFSYKFYQKDEEEIELKTLKQYLENLEPRTYHLEIDGLEDGQYLVTIYSINEERGSVQDEWIRKNCEDYVGHAQMLFLNYSSQPDVRISTAQTRHGLLTLDFTLNPLEILSIEVSKKHSYHNPAQNPHQSA